MKYAKPLLFAFGFGGLFTLIAAIMRHFIALVAPVDLVDPIMLACLGLLGAVLYATGVHQRIAPRAGAGAFLPLNGFSAAVAETFEQTKASGASCGRAFLQGVLLLVKVILSGTAIVMALTFVLWLAR